MVDARQEGRINATMHLAYLGMGSSLGDRKAHLQAALNQLTTATGSTRVVSVSPLYESPHLGLQSGDAQRYPAHLNCVVMVETILTPLELLYNIQQIEAQGQRQRAVRWGPRTIDIDILLYEALILKSNTLTLPHPEMKKRAFVLKPLFDLVPDLVFPEGEPLQELLHSDSICAQEIERVQDDELFI